MSGWRPTKLIREWEALLDPIEAVASAAQHLVKGFRGAMLHYSDRFIEPSWNTIALLRETARNEDVIASLSEIGHVVDGKIVQPGVAHVPGLAVYDAAQAGTGYHGRQISEKIVAIADRQRAEHVEEIRRSRDTTPRSSEGSTSSPPAGGDCLRLRRLAQCLPRATC